MTEYIKQYPAIVEPSSNGYGVYFPYLPGLGTAGETYDDAIKMAKEALSLHLAGIIEDGEVIPNFNIKTVVDSAKKTSSIVAFIEPDIVLLKKLIKGKAKRVNITINPLLLELVDKRAKELHINRSKLIESGLELVLGREVASS